MVGLRQQRPASVLETLNDPDLPQWMLSIERPAGNVRDHLAELARATRRGTADAADVVVDVEVRIFDPHGMVQAERYFDDPAPERREEVDARRKDVLHRLERIRGS